MKWYEWTVVVLFVLLMVVTTVEHMTQQRMLTIARTQVMRDVRSEAQRCTIAMPCKLAAVGITIIPMVGIRIDKESDR